MLDSTVTCCKLDMLQVTKILDAGREMQETLSSCQTCEQSDWLECCTLLHLLPSLRPF